VFNKIGEKDLVSMDLTNLVHVRVVQLHHFYNSLLFISFVQKSIFLLMYFFPALELTF